MPITLFEAIKDNIGAFLGGAEVNLAESGDELAGQEGGISETILLEDKPYTFTARRPAIPFTRTERDFCLELLTAFAAMYGGFRQEGYAAHFRTALLASIMDITVARSLRGDHRKGFWPIQQLIQLLKNLSYQRYEGKPATTGFLVHRTTPQNLAEVMDERGHIHMGLQPHHDISADFFANPLTYRFIDGTNLFFVANIRMEVTGVLRTATTHTLTDVERLTQREMFSLVRRTGTSAFAITVNEASEIEALLSPAKILIRRKGNWAIFDPDLFRAFLAGSLEGDAADDLIWTVYALSKSRHGTVILIHDGGEVPLSLLKKGSVGGDDPVGHLLIGWLQGRSIGELKQTGALLRLLSADGMTVFGRDARLLETGFIIDTSHARKVVTGGGRSTAASAASYFGKVIKVSQDGPVELYHYGHVVYRFG